MTREEVRLGMHVRGIGIATLIPRQGTIVSFIKEGVLLHTGNYVSYIGLELIESPPVAPSRTEFPHTCPRCGRPAYVGLRTVDHQYNTSECR